MKVVIWLLAIVVSVNAYGVGGGTSWGKVTELYVHGSWTMVRVSGITENPDECESVAFYALNSSDANYEVLHSTLMASFMSGKEVRFWLNSCGGQHSKHPHITSVFVR